MKPNEQGKAAGLTVKDGQTIQRCCGRLENAIKMLDGIEDATGYASEARSEAVNLLESARAITRNFYTIQPGDE